VYEVWPSSLEFEVFTIEECVRYVLNELPKWKYPPVKYIPIYGRRWLRFYGIPKYIHTSNQVVIGYSVQRAAIFERGSLLRELITACPSF